MTPATSWSERRARIEEYFDRTASDAWARLTSDAPVSRIRATVREGRDRMRATLEPLSGARVRVTIGRVDDIVHRPHHGNTLDKSAVRHLRDYLSHARCTPSQYESSRH